MEYVKSRGASVGWYPSGLRHGCNAATVDSSPENREVQKSIKELLFVFSWHRLVYKEGHNRESCISCSTCSETKAEADVGQKGWRKVRKLIWGWKSGYWSPLSVHELQSHSPGGQQYWMVSVLLARPTDSMGWLQVRSSFLLSSPSFPLPLAKLQHHSWLKFEQQVL